MERAARGLVIVTAATLLFALVAAHRVLRHSSGTYMALVAFAPILLAPGALVFWKPRPRFLAVWAIWSFISSVIYLIGGSPYYYERELPDWPSVQWPSWIAIVLAIVGSSAVAYLAAAKAQAPLPPTPRTRRIQQAARLSVALAVVAVLVPILGLRAPAEASFFNAAIIAFIVAPAPYVHRVARRGTAIMWAAWASPFAASMAIMWFASKDQPQDLELPLRMWLFSYGTLMTMICIVTPLVAFVSSDKVSELPTARVQ